MPAKVALIFLKFDNASKTYELNPEAQEELSKLERLVRVDSVQGKPVARIGKSTSLNVISHIWSGAKQYEVEEIFKTGTTRRNPSRMMSGLTPFTHQMKEAEALRCSMLQAQIWVTTH